MGSLEWALLKSKLDAIRIEYESLPSHLQAMFQACYTHEDLEAFEMALKHSVMSGRLLRKHPLSLSLNPSLRLSLNQSLSPSLSRSTFPTLQGWINSSKALTSRSVVKVVSKQLPNVSKTSELNSSTSVEVLYASPNLWPWMMITYPPPPPLNHHPPCQPPREML